MRASVLVLILVSGCFRSKMPAYVAGGTAATAGTLLVAATATTDCGDQFLTSELCRGSNTTMLLTGVLLLVAGLSAIAVGATLDDDPVERWNPAAAAIPIVPTGPIPEPASEDPQLRELTLQASIAASVGRCDEVSALAKTVDALDRGYRIAGFVRDPRVRACLHQ